MRNRGARVYSKLFRYNKACVNCKHLDIYCILPLYCERIGSPYYDHMRKHDRLVLFTKWTKINIKHEKHKMEIIP